MPRTKISKNAKRDRQAANDELTERLKEIDAINDQTLSTMDGRFHQTMKIINESFTNLRRSLPESILSMKFGDFKKLNVNTLNEFKEISSDSGANSKLVTSSSITTTIKNSTFTNNRKISKEDEGYLTEDGVTTNTAVSTLQQELPVIHHNSRRLGPLSSAKAKGRHRRSRSALTITDNLRSAVDSCSTTSSSSTRSSKLKNNTSQIRTMSVDRAQPVTPKIAPNAPVSVLRYPRLGETVISLSGSPLVAQVLSDPTANVNIPLRNGMISLRPTKLNDNEHHNIVTQIDSETLDQIKQLQSNLNTIMNIVKKGGL